MVFPSKVLQNSVHGAASVQPAAPSPDPETRLAAPGLTSDLSLVQSQLSHAAAAPCSVGSRLGRRAPRTAAWGRSPPPWARGLGDSPLSASGRASTVPAAVPGWQEEHAGQTQMASCRWVSCLLRSPVFWLQMVARRWHLWLLWALAPWVLSSPAGRLGLQRSRSRLRGRPELWPRALLGRRSTNLVLQPPAAAGAQGLASGYSCVRLQLRHFCSCGPLWAPGGSKHPRCSQKTEEPRAGSSCPFPAPHCIRHSLIPRMRDAGSLI